RHDALILLAPALLHFLELRLAHHVFDAGREMARHPAHPADPIADRSHDLGKVLRADENQRENRDDYEFARINAEHGAAGSGARLVVSRWRSDWIGGTRSYVNRIARQLARVGAALLLVALDLVVILVGHAFLEALHPLGDVLHHVRKAVAPEQEQEKQAENDPVNEAKTAHGDNSFEAAI